MNCLSSVAVGTAAGQSGSVAVAISIATFAELAIATEFRWWLGRWLSSS